MIPKMTLRMRKIDVNRDGDQNDKGNASAGYEDQMRDEQRQLEIERFLALIVHELRLVFLYQPDNERDQKPQDATDKMTDKRHRAIIWGGIDLRVQCRRSNRRFGGLFRRTSFGHEKPPWLMGRVTFIGAMCLLDNLSKGHAVLAGNAGAILVFRRKHWWLPFTPAQLSMHGTPLRLNRA